MKRIFTLHWNFSRKKIPFLHCDFLVCLNGSYCSDIFFIGFHFLYPGIFWGFWLQSWEKFIYISLCPLQCCDVVREETMNSGQKRIISGVAGREEGKILYFVTGFFLISSLLQELNSHVASSIKFVSPWYSAFLCLCVLLVCILITYFVASFDIPLDRCNNITQCIYFWKTALYVSGRISTHYEEHIQLYLQYLVLVNCNG